MAAVLHPAVGVVHDARLDGAVSQRPVQCAERQFRTQLLAQLPTHDPPRISVHHDRHIQERLSQAHVGDVGHPQLVHAAESQAGGQVRIHRIALLGIRREDEPLLPHGQQVVGAHEPQHALVVGYHSQVVQFRGHAAIPVEAILQHDLLDEVAQRNVRLPRFVLLVVAVEAGPADVRDVAGVAGLEALKLHHASDLSVDAVAPSAVFFRRDSFTRLKALRKKSISRACCPTLRSNSATRRATTSAGLATGRGGLGTPGGRPTDRCSPAAPSLRYASRQRYSTLRLIWTSWCKALTLSPLSIRSTTPSLNFLVKTRFFPDSMGLLPFNENCP